MVGQSKVGTWVKNVSASTRLGSWNGTRKQIFFATADAKLAALFQRKFEFLGEERFKKTVLAR